MQTAFLCAWVDAFPTSEMIDKIPAWRQPAEWTPHEACWVAWPSAGDLWGEDLAPVQRAFAAMCHAIADVDPEGGVARGERLEVLVPDVARELEARAALPPAGTRFHRVEFGDIWLRDIAPIFVAADGQCAAATFAFNGWGGKYVLPHDAEVAGRIAEITALPTLRFAWVLEGGAVEVDGEGTCLTTRQCLQNPNRNPALDVPSIERELRRALGATHVLWLDRGLANDHTDGHVDTLARFCQPGVVVCMEPRGVDDPNADALRAIVRSLGAMSDARGRRLELVRVPSPGRIESADGGIMPASYVNYFVGNRSIVVPTYGAPWDAEAVEAIGRLYPGRRTVGVDASHLLKGGGAFHCITQQQPLASEAARFSSPQAGTPWVSSPQAGTP